MCGSTLHVAQAQRVFLPRTSNWGLGMFVFDEGGVSKFEIYTRAAGRASLPALYTNASVPSRLSP